jgi:hypothetical protein
MPIELGSFSIGAAAGGFVVGLVNHFLTKSRDMESCDFSRPFPHLSA